jgi:hypothetical protein
MDSQGTQAHRADLSVTLERKQLAKNCRLLDEAPFCHVPVHHAGEHL